MADKRGLRLIGFVYGGLTAAVTLTACAVVANHVSAQASLERTAEQALEIPVAAR
ncbi:MAG: hypothetical protein AB7K35_14695 [Pseudorhodoplanes sp.]